jgi:hypothetical protein
MNARSRRRDLEIDACVSLPRKLNSSVFTARPSSRTLISTFVARNH